MPLSRMPTSTLRDAGLDCVRLGRVDLVHVPLQRLERVGALLGPAGRALLAVADGELSARDGLLVAGERLPAPVLADLGDERRAAQSLHEEHVRGLDHQHADLARQIVLHDAPRRLNERERGGAIGGDEASGRLRSGEHDDIALRHVHVRAGVDRETAERDDKAERDGGETNHPGQTDLLGDCEDEARSRSQVNANPIDSSINNGFD